MKFIIRFVVESSRWAIRLFPFLVLGCVLMFPAFKGLWLGYVPVLAGLVLAGGLYARRDRVSTWAGTLSPVRLAVFLYVLPAAVQLLLILAVRSAASFDGLFVYRHAVTLAETGRMDPMTYYPPAQAWWYAFWFKLFSPSELVAQLSQIPLSLGVTWAVYRLARELHSEAAGRLAGLAAAWYPSFLAYVLTTPYYHYLYTLAMVLMVWGLVRFGRDGAGAARAALLAGVAAGGGALTKATQLIAPLQFGTWLLVMAFIAGWIGVPWRKWAVGVLLFGAGMIAAVGPWAVRNAMVFDDFVPVCTSGGLVLYSANNPESNGLYSNIPDEVDLQTPAEMLAYSRECSERAKAYIAENPVRFAKLAAFKFLHTWGIEATFADLINVRGQVNARLQDVFSLIFFAGWSALVLLWSVHSWQRIRSRASLSSYEVLAGVIILSNAVVFMVFEGGDRHHLPLVPLLLAAVAMMMAHGNRAKSA